jgi:hypothetical protein
MQYYKVICKVSELGTKIAKFGKNKQSNDKSKENLNMMKNWGVKVWLLGLLSMRQNALMAYLYCPPLLSLTMKCTLPLVLQIIID